VIPMLRRIIVTFGVVSIVVCLCISWLIGSTSGLRVVAKLIPGLSYASLDGRLIGPLHFHDLKYQSKEVEVQLKEIKLNWRLRSLLSSGEFNISELVASDLVVTVSGAQDEASEELHEGLSPVDLPVDISLNNLVLSKLSLSVEGKKFEIDSLSSSHLSLEESRLKLKNIVARKAGDNVDISGTIDLSFAPQGIVNLALSHSIQGEDTFPKPLIGQHQLAGSWQSLNATVDLNGGAQMSGNVTISDVLSDQRNWNAHLELNEFNTSLLNNFISENSSGANAVDDGIVTGVLNAVGTRDEVDFTANIKLNSGNLPSAISAASNETTELTLSGLVTQLSGDTNFDIELNAVKLDNVANLIGLKTPSFGGVVKVQGSATRYTIESLVNATGESLGRFDFTLLAEGNSQQLVANAFSVDGDEFNFESDLLLTFAQPSRYGITIETARGRVNGNDFTARVEAEASGSTATINTLVINHADSVVDVSGSVGNVLDLKWDINLTDLEKMVSGASGAFKSRGALVGDTNAPLADFTFEAQNVSFGGDTIAQASGAVLVDTSQNNTLKGDIVFNGIALANKPFITTLGINLSGELPKHQLEVTSLFDNGSSARLEWNGAFTDDTINFELSSDAIPISAIESLIQVNEFSVSGVAMLDTRGSFNTSTSTLLLDLELSSNEIKLEPEARSNQPLYLRGVKVLLAATEAESRLNASTRIDSLTDLSSRQRDDAGEQVASVESGELTLEGHLASPVLADTLGSSALNLKGVLNYPDVSSINSLLPDNTRVAGKMESILQVSGSLKTPEVTVKTKLTGGRFTASDIGLELDNVSVDISPSSPSETQFLISANAGQGTISARGEVTTTSQWNVSSTVTASDALLLNSKDISAQVDADLNLNISEQLIEIEGDVAVDKASLLVGVEPGVILESEDLVVLGEEVRKDTAQLSLDVGIDFGDNTLIDASGLNGRLSGAPRLRTGANNLLVSSGEIRVLDGKFNLFGEELIVSKGIASYTGGSIENPLLDIEAVKESGDNTVGVKISGLASAPVITLFSQPYFTDQDILSLMFFNKTLNDLSSSDAFRLVEIANAIRRGNSGGSRLNGINSAVASYLGVDKFDVDINSVNGDEAVSVSSKVNSKINIGYAYNLVSALQSLFVKYKINDKWSIQSSVDTETGADLVFKGER